MTRCVEVSLCGGWSHSPEREGTIAKVTSAQRATAVQAVVTAVEGALVGPLSNGAADILCVIFRECPFSGLGFPRRWIDKAR